MGANGFAAVNACAGLAAANYTWSNGYTTDRDKLNDGRMDSKETIGAVSTGFNLIIDFGAAVALSGFAILNHNAAVSQAVSLKVEADTSGGFGTAVTAKAASALNQTAPYNREHVLQFSSLSKRYWRLTWTWGGGGSINFSIGEVFAYSALNSMSRRTIYGSGESHRYIVEQVQMQYGEMRTLYKSGPIRELQFNYSDLNATARGEVEAMWTLSNGGMTPLLWVPSQESGSVAAATPEQECVLGRLTKSDFGWKEVDYSLFDPDGFSLLSLSRGVGL
jgi:hypothetical protein